jgi:transglutaminase-like putative cysteine protease
MALIAAMLRSHRAPCRSRPADPAPARITDATTGPVSLSPQVIRLRPAPHSRTRVISHSLKVSPAKHFVNHQQDPYGNWLARFVFPEPVREFRIEVDLVADMTVYNPFDFFVEESAEHWPFDYPSDLRDDLSLPARPRPPARASKPGSKACRGRARRTVDFLVDLNARLVAGDRLRHPHGAGRADAGGDAGARLRLLPRHRLAAGADPAPPGLRGALRLGLPDPAEAGQGGAGRPLGHRARLHRPARLGEVYLPGAGWIGLDPTSGLLPGESHIPLAATPHYRNAAPISGLASPAEVDFDFHMEVAPRRGASAHHQAVLRRELGGARRAGHSRSTPRWRAATCA